MRNFEERLGEIRRRGEEMKRKRKNRQRMLAACIPLILCVGLCGLFLPDWKATPVSGENLNPSGVVGDPSSETQRVTAEDFPVQQIRVEGCGLQITHTEDRALRQIDDLLGELMRRQEDPSTSPVNPVSGSDDPAVGGKEGDSDDMGFVVTVETRDGVQQYYLLGSTLKNLQSGCSRHLEEKDLFALKGALGIPCD